ncbi:MAG: restriction endonuclease subunit S [Clostridia bacterium]|nr:restriction endonuclease subunit S [Clostridia bacterium]
MGNKVKLGDVVSRVQDKVNKDNTNLEYYIGGEHIDEHRRVITKKGVLKGSTIGPAFHMRFMPGDVLLMSRNPHLCKASMADFEGICSDVSYVIRTKNESIFSQRLLPFVVQTKAFWKFAEEHKRGGMPFFLNWRDFAEFEFNLPDIEEQKKIADLLWAAEMTKQAYEKQLHLTNELIKSRFIEMFGDVTLESQNTVKLGLICKTVGGGTPTTKKPEYYEGNIPWITTVSLGPNYIDGSDAKGYITPEAINNSATKLISPNSVMVGTRVGVGKCSVNTVPICTNQDINSITDLDLNKYLPLFIKNVVDSYQSYFDSIKKGSTILGITSDDLKKINVPKVSLNVQKEFVSFIELIDKSKFELVQSIDKVEKIIRSLSEEIFA